MVRQFRRQLPSAQIYVFDNGSTDRTEERAREAGAVVRYEGRRGKGYVIQSMFRQVEADLYVMVDGDGIYWASEVHRLIAPLICREAGMVVGARWLERSRSKSKPLNLAGNAFFLTVVNILFGTTLTDVLSGYRAFSREFVKGVRLTRGGFETEVELTIKAVRGGWRIIEVPISLSEQPAGSHSKIGRDG